MPSIPARERLGPRSGREAQGRQAGCLRSQRARLALWHIEGEEKISNVLGNTQGLKANQLRRIEKLYTRRIPPREIVTQEFARQLTELSHETRRQIGALIDRKGHVEYVMVGDNRRIELPDFKRVRVATDRFRGLRFVHTHLRGEELTQDDLTDLALLRLDLMAAIDVDPETGLPGLIRAAHLLPDIAAHNSKTGGSNTDSQNARRSAQGSEAHESNADRSSARTSYSDDSDVHGTNAADSRSRRDG